MAQPSETSADVEIKFTFRVVSAWVELALMKWMLDSMDLRTTTSQWLLSPPSPNRGYSPAQLIEQLLEPSGVTCAALSASLPRQVLAVNALWHRVPKQNQLLLAIS